MHIWAAHTSYYAQLWQYICCRRNFGYMITKVLKSKYKPFILYTIYACCFHIIQYFLLILHSVVQPGSGHNRAGLLTILIKYLSVLLKYILDLFDFIGQALKEWLGLCGCAVPCSIYLGYTTELTVVKFKHRHYHKYIGKFDYQAKQLMVKKGVSL